MAINGNGSVSWATPVAGSYAVTVAATDTRTGLSGQAVYTIIIAAAPSGAPVVTSGHISGRVGTALSFAVSVTASNPVSYTLSGAPSGMTISSAGVINWATPAAGSYSVSVTAKDTRTGLSGQGTFAVTISAAGPVITASAMTGVAGRPLTGTISIADPGASSISVSISSAPMGMRFSVSGTTITAAWANPVSGTYSLNVTAIDSNRLSTQAIVPVTIAPN
jgi:hypothetical protein